MDIKMSNVDITPDGLHKSAIIYRDDSARFIYVCFHCGCTFNEINETLQHIESHFQLGNVKRDHLSDCFALQSLATQETVDIKIEPDSKKYAVEDNTPRSDLATSEDVNRKFRCKVCNSIHSSKFLVRLHALTAHINEPMRCCVCKTTFTRTTYFENHLKKHITKGDVSWKSVTEGIPRSLDVDWSTYEEEVEHHDNVKEEKLQTIPSSAVPSSTTTVKRNQPSASQKKREYSRPYRCHKCPLKFRYVKALRTHFEKHANHDLMDICRCKECDIFYKNPYELRIHVLEVHRMIEQFSCNACELQFDCAQSKQFEEHLEMHNNGPNDNKLWTNIRDGVNQPKDFDCSKYEEILSFTEEQHSCEFCTQRFHLRSNLDLHVKGIHYGQRRLQCGQCVAVFTTPKYYFAHQLEHQRVGPIITERDDNVLLANLDACIEERIIYDENELNEQTFRCLICNVAFNSNHNIRCHIREQHIYKMFTQPIEPKKKFICDLCGAQLKTKKVLKNHLLVHTNIKSHACTICGKQFRQNSDRKIHERQHTGEKPYQCHECGRAFISRGLLTAHKKTHDDTTYPCPICGKVFNLPSGYRNHVKTHRVDRPFICETCGKSYNTKQHLRRHETIHS